MTGYYGENKIRLDALIKIVASGGKVKTGIDIFNKPDVLILEKMYWYKILTFCLI